MTFIDVNRSYLRDSMKLFNRAIRAFWRCYRAGARFLANDVLARVFPSMLALVSRLRVASTILVLVSISSFGVGLLMRSQSTAAVAGLFMDIAGILKLMVRDEWRGIIRAFEDPEQYPYGPPSYVTREMFAEDNPDALGDNRELRGMAPYFYTNRGYILIVVGFLMQACAYLIPSVVAPSSG